MSSAAPYVVGIDLGTTNSAVAYVAPHPPRAVQTFEVPRWVDAARLDRAPTLPSALYAPLPDESQGENWLVGELARRRGLEIPGRTIVSAKSWLSHPAVDRRADILPWGGDPQGPRLSPVAASRRILEEVRKRWDEAFPENPLASQSVILTVPASFDPVARQLTVEAANLAGLPVRLLEEPSAAFYDYLDSVGTQAFLQRLDGAAAELLVLVCDVGGGTTDLTLLRIYAASPGELRVDRTAVGRHLLLGGDNMDLALAHQLEPRLTGPNQPLDTHRFNALTSACRDAKELLLSDPSVASVPVVIAGSGAALVGQTRSTSLLRSDVEDLLLEGFFPSVQDQERARRSRSGLLGLGLRYESDPAITRHVSEFLARHLLPGKTLDSVLFNGGVFASVQLADRLWQCLRPWLSERATRLVLPHPELAVARGASLYGRALSGQGLLLGGGSAQGYYLAVDEPLPSGEQRALCVVPRASAEAEPHRAGTRPLRLRVGTPVRFELFALDHGPCHTPGEVVTIDSHYDALPPVAIHFETAAKTEEVSVVLQGELTAVGTLELCCVATDAPNQAKPQRFVLAFELRQTDEERTGAVAPAPAPRTDSDRLDLARDALARVFGKSRSDVSKKEVRDLWRTLERSLGPRASWSLEHSRLLFDELGPRNAARRRSPEHERLYWMLVGFLVRPGFGHPLDRTRLRNLVPLFEQSLSFSEEIRGWQQWFTAWRRLAGGLLESEQDTMARRLLPYLTARVSPGPKGKSQRPLADPEMAAFLAFLERAAVGTREQLGEALLERLYRRSEPWLWEALGRVGARQPVYASLHHAVPVSRVADWLAHLLREDWQAVPTAARAASMLARRTGDRARDIPETLRADVLRRMVKTHARPEYIALVETVVPVDERDRLEQFGEELPVGLCFSDEIESGSD